MRVEFGEEREDWKQTVNPHEWKIKGIKWLFFPKPKIENWNNFAEFHSKPPSEAIYREFWKKKYLINQDMQSRQFNTSLISQLTFFNKSGIFLKVIKNSFDIEFCLKNLNFWCESMKSEVFDFQKKIRVKNGFWIN